MADTTSARSLFSYPAIRRLVVVYFLSSFGSAMGSVAIAFLAYRESESVVLTALVLAGNTVPFLAVAPISARLIVHTDARTLLVFSQVTKVLLLGAAALLSSSGDLRYGVLLGGTFIYGALSAVAAPAWPRVMEAIAPPNRLTDVNAFFRAAPGPAYIIGAVTGGIIAATAGPPWVLGIDAFTYVPCSIVVALLPRVAPIGRRGETTLRPSARAVMSSESLQRAFLFAMVLNLAAFPLLSTLPALAVEIDPDSHTLGFLQGAFYAGAALVAIAVVWLRRRFRYSHVLEFGFLLAGLVLIVQAVVVSWREPGHDALVLALLTMLPIGLALNMNSALLQSLVQVESGDQKAGVLVMYATVSAIMTPIGGIVIGVVADTLSLWWALAGAGVVLIVLVLALHRQLAVFDALDTHDGPQHVRRQSHAHWATHSRHALTADVAEADHV